MDYALRANPPYNKKIWRITLEKIKLSQSALRWSWISLLVIIADQITKFLAIVYLPFNQAIPILPFFNLALAHNRGAAFSFLGQRGGWTAWLFGSFAVIISVLIVTWLTRLNKTERWLAIALALILGGAIGNLIDRVHYGFVIDFIQLYYKQWYWPAFNIADSAICVGAVMLGIEMLFLKNSSSHA